MSDSLLILLLLVCIAIGYCYIQGFVINNTLSKAIQLVREARGNIAAVIARRVDTVNRLIDIVTTYVKHEHLTHINVAASSASIASLLNASSQASFALNRIATFAANFPQLKADTLYQNLMHGLQSIELEVQAKRERYNGAVKDYNSYRNEIPNVLVAYICDYAEEKYFGEIEAEGVASDNLKTSNSLIKR